MKNILIGLVFVTLYMSFFSCQKEKSKEELLIDYRTKFEGVYTCNGRYEYYKNVNGDTSSIKKDTTIVIKIEKVDVEDSTMYFHYPFAFYVKVNALGGFQQDSARYVYPGAPGMFVVDSIYFTYSVWSKYDFVKWDLKGKK